MNISSSFSLYPDGSYKMSESFSQGNHTGGKANPPGVPYKVLYDEIMLVFQSPCGTYLALNRDGAIPDNPVWKFHSVGGELGKYLDLSSPQNALFHRQIQMWLDIWHPVGWILKKLWVEWTEQQMQVGKANATFLGRLAGSCVNDKGRVYKMWLKPEAHGSIMPIFKGFGDGIPPEDCLWYVQVFMSEAELQLRNNKSPPFKDSSMSLDNQQASSQGRHAIGYPDPNTGVYPPLVPLKSATQNVQSNQEVSSKDKHPNRFLGQSTNSPVSSSVPPLSARHNFQTYQRAATQEMNSFGYPGSGHANNSIGSYPLLQDTTHELAANGSPLFRFPIPNHGSTVLSASRKSCTQNSVTINNNFGLNGSKGGASSAGNPLHSDVSGNINEGGNQSIEGVNIQTSVKNEQNIFINFQNN